VRHIGRVPKQNFGSERLFHGFTSSTNIRRRWRCRSSIAIAAIDRLVRHATIPEMNVESYQRRAALDRKRGPGRPRREHLPRPRLGVHLLGGLPVLEHICNVALYRSAPQLRVSKLIAVTSQTPVTARIVATFAPALYAPICRFEAHAKNVRVFDMSDKAGTTGDSVIKHNDRKARRPGAAYSDVQVSRRHIHHFCDAF
jgi:hypothetical protein